MRRFNPEKELRKIQHGNKNKIIVGVIALLVVLAIGSTYALYQVRYSKRIIYTKVAPFSNKDLNLAVYVNGEKQNKAPEINSGYKLLDMICDTPYKGSVTWDDTKALLSLPPMPIPNKCNVYLIDNNYDGIKTFEYNGDVQEYIVPKDGLYEIELWGAAGGSSIYNQIFQNEALGGYTSGFINLRKDEKLYFYVGEKGKVGRIGAYQLNGTSFNGGGSGIGATDNNDGGGGGGGATDVRLIEGKTWDDFDSLKSRIMVAAGGSGGTAVSQNKTYISAGSGGGLTGVGESWHWQDIKFDTRFNATQTTGYQFGKGENGYATGSGGSGGGGGYYGGLADNISSFSGGGGGGSSFISGHEGCDAIDNVKSTDINTIFHTGQEVHYSGYKFTNTVMIDGLGYYWTNSRQTYIGMPTFDGKGIMQGNTSNGYAKITYFGPD